MVWHCNSVSTHATLSSLSRTSACATQRYEVHTAKPLDPVKAVDTARVKDAASRATKIKFPHGSSKFTGIAYLTDFVPPNFYFHVSMAYALLRKNGIEIGKGDFLGAIQ